MPYTSPFSGGLFDGIDESTGQRMVELLGEENPRVKDIWTAKDFVRLINQCIESIENEAGQQVHRGALTALAMEWRDSIGRN